MGVNNKTNALQKMNNILRIKHPQPIPRLFGTQEYYCEFLIIIIQYLSDFFIPNLLFTLFRFSIYAGALRIDQSNTRI